MGFGARLKQLRTEHGMKQSDLGSRLGVTSATISAYENETRTPDINTASELADLFNVSVDDLVGRKAKDDMDLKSLLKNQSTMSYGGQELSERDINTISRLLGAYLADNE